MIDLASLVMICQTIHAGGSKVIEAYKKKRFSGAERQLLIAAANRFDDIVMPKHKETVDAEL